MSRQIKPIFIAYLILGSLYFLVKVVFFAFGFVYFCGVVLGFLASVLTIGAGIFAFRERRETSRFARWSAVVFPLLILPLTPTVMIHNLGEEMFQPEKMAVFFLFELLAFLQVILAVRMIEKSIRDGG